MDWTGRHFKTTFILGAGATRGAFHHTILNRKRIKAPLNGDFFEVAHTFVRARQDDHELHRRFDRIKRVFRDEFPTRGRWPIPMEEAFSLLYVSKDFPEIFAARHGRRRDAGGRQEIEDFLSLTFDVLSTIESLVEGDTLYSPFVQHLGGADTVITLNYDTLLDSALVSAGWDPAKGYELIGGPNKFDWRRSTVPKCAHLAKVKLLKLHGSINWYVRGGYQKLAHVFDSKPNKVLISAKPRTNEIHGYIRQVVPPIYGKFFGHDHWRRLWTAAYRSLIESDMLVVIGCSLVDTDFHLIGMLGHAVTERKKRGKPFTALTLVDKAKVRHKWARLFRGCVGKLYSCPNFADFAKRYLKMEAT